MLVFDIKLLVLLVISLITAIALLSAFTAHRAGRKGYLTRDQNTHQVFDDAPFGLLLYKDKVGILYQNKFVLALQSAKADGVQANPTPLLTEQHKLLGDLQAAARSTVHAQPMQTTLSLANGKTLICWVVGHGNTLATAYLLDLSQQRRSETEIRNFISTLSHELRTPFTVMLSHLQIARSAEFAADTREASLELVHREVRHTSHLVQEMTLLASLEATGPGDMRLIDVVLVADNALSRVALVAEDRQIGIELVTETAIPRVSGHPEQLLQVFINVLDNALKYCRAGDNINLRLRAESGYVICEIQDTGPGIPAEHLPYLTQRLYRVRRDKDGFGLGLAIVEEILRNHQSHLEVESTFEGTRTGTTIRFRLAAT